MWLTTSCFMYYVAHHITFHVLHKLKKLLYGNVCFSSLLEYQYCNTLYAWKILVNQLEKLQGLVAFHYQVKDGADNGMPQSLACSWLSLRTKSEKASNQIILYPEIPFINNCCANAHIILPAICLRKSLCLIAFSRIHGKETNNCCFQVLTRQVKKCNDKNLCIVYFYVFYFNYCIGMVVCVGIYGYKFIL